MSHLGHHNLLYHLQHGKFASDIVDDSHAKQKDIIIWDFSKASDKVPHNRLLYKLENYGIRGDTLK